MKCPKCGLPPKRFKTKYGVRNACCDLWSWGNNAPLVDEDTHSSRKQAHLDFDQIWQQGIMTRSEAYTVLAVMMNMKPRDCHIKLMTADQAKKVSALSTKIKTDMGVKS